MKLRGWAILILALAVLAVPFLLADWELKEVDTGPTPEARSDPFLALERFAEELDLDVRREAAVGELPPTNQTLLFALRGGRVSPQTIERLVEWVSAGGRLWIVPDGTEAASDALVGWSRGDEVDPLLGAFDLDWRRASPGSTSTVASFDDRAYSVDFSGTVLLDADDESLLDETGFLADLLHGGGSLVVMSDGRWLTNDGLGEEDHATLAWDLLLREGRPAGLVVVRGGKGSNLMAWLLGPGLTFAVAALLALAFLLARRGMRLGPVVDELPRGRRDFAEHLEAAGTYLWRRTDRAALVRRLRDAVAPAAPKSGAELDAWLTREAEQTGLEHERLVQAWTSARAPDGQGFVRIVRTLAAQAGAHHTDPRWNR